MLGTYKIFCISAFVLVSWDPAFELFFFTSLHGKVASKYWNYNCKYLFDACDLQNILYKCVRTSFLGPSTWTFFFTSLHYYFVQLVPPGAPYILMSVKYLYKRAKHLCSLFDTWNLQNILHKRVRTSFLGPSIWTFFFHQFTWKSSVQVLKL